MGMPLREYYPVKRAAELLGCEVGDLFHWASIGAIKLYVSFENGTGFVRFFGDGIKNEDRDLDRFTEEQFESAAILKNELCTRGFVSDSFSRVLDLFIKDEEGNIDNSIEKDGGYPCSFSGLWALPHTAFGVGVLYDFQPSLYDLFLSINNKMFVSFELDEFINLELDGIYVIKSDFLTIKNCSDGEELPNYINGGKEKIVLPKNPDHTYPLYADDAHSTKTINLRTQFIKSLLRIHYGNEVAEKPRRFLDGNDSDIRKDFKNLNIIAPSGKTVQGWVNEVDIPFSVDE
ncbi:hypothetical protein IG605_019240 [Pectobacterium quasiaquaticum]|uniref:Uncharacterized protein n=1 Tax=Pectobacterium wasabiae TaxID=55208 RepID=A0AAW3EDX9_9GAMM|nr:MULTISPECIES: hypothetical protein [Pectobacterium]AOR63216.1 hypothetical protein A7983_08095 [Pectobacterium wasabiae CFBP 3304]EJS96207.1 Hypothetical protein Y17_0566 [Pectobacterium wasabiae CFBP 3304]KFX04282.1 hypothetical protein JV38_17360 [Pectobacterium wasabiae]KGA27416.1 hypothetical protein KU73_17350 [Pectobacterium wasabiae]MCA6926008.1 hypothetical protein [Pectobacterium versatile]